MTRASGGLTVLTALAIAGVIGLCPAHSPRASADEAPAAPAANAPDPALAGSTISAVLRAYGGRVPPTGKELWRVLSRIGTFAQLPVVFSAVRLDSGIGNPRVVIAPVADGTDLSDAAAISPSLNGRLFLAANMERGQKGQDPRVTSVEFISWNAHTRRFDFGFIDGMDQADPPQLRIVDGGRCFSCHKNKGPILGAGPWTNTTHQSKLRMLVADRLTLVDSLTPTAISVGLRDRIDGMALVAPQAQAVDSAVRLGATFRLNNDTFRLMNASDAGRKAFVALLGAIVRPGPLNINDRNWKTAVDPWGNDRSYDRFATDWLHLAKATNLGVLMDFAPLPKPVYGWGANAPQPVPPPPPGGFRTSKEAKNYEQRVETIVTQNKRLAAAEVNNLQLIVLHDQARANGLPGTPSLAQPSNPKAFVQPAPRVTVNPSGMVNPVMLASTIGLTEGDRRFMTQALADQVARLAKQKVTVTPAALAKAVFEGPQFADVLAGGSLPDRDDFKDRFVAGLDTLLTTRYKLAEGFAPDRGGYARDARRDPKAVEEAEAAVVPTSACLRCHDVRDGAKGRLVEPIPALAFDPFDERGRAVWLQTANPKRKQEVLARLRERLHTDADMPPQDSPEHELFRVKGAAAFNNLKRFLDTELDKFEKP